MKLTTSIISAALCAFNLVHVTTANPDTDLAQEGPANHHLVARAFGAPMPVPNKLVTRQATREQIVARSVSAAQGLKKRQFGGPSAVIK